MSARHSADEDVLDRGLAIERTALAWTRSGLAVAVIGALVIKAAAGTSLEAFGYAAGATCVVLAAGLRHYAGTRYELGRGALRGTAAAARPRAVMFLATVTAAIAVAAMIVTWLA